MSGVERVLSDLVERSETTEDAVEDYLSGELQTEVEVTELDPSYGDKGDVYVAFDLPEMETALEACLADCQPDGVVGGNVVLEMEDDE